MSRDLISSSTTETTPVKDAAHMLRRAVGKRREAMPANPASVRINLAVEMAMRRWFARCYVCPACGGDHHADEHDLHGARGLSADELRRLREQVAEEALLAIRRGADAAVLAQFAGLADALDVRLADLDRHATVAQRQRVAVEAGANAAPLHAT